MKRTNIIELKLTKQQARILKEILIRSSAIWNIGNYEKRQAFFKKNKIPSNFKLAETLKTHPLYKNLGSAYAQQILNKLQEAWNSFFGSIKSKKVKNKVGLPRYFKNRKTDQTTPSLLICRNDCYRIDERYIYISCPKDLKQKYGVKGLLRIKYNGVLKWSGTQKRMEIKYIPYIKKFYAHQVVENKIQTTCIKKRSKHVSSGDIGIKRYLVNYIKNTKDFVVLYPSEHVFKEYMKLSKKIYDLQSIAKRENGRYSTRRIRRLFLKRKRKLANYMNNIIADLFRKLSNNQVSRYIVGDLSHIRNAQLPIYFKNKKKLNTMIQNFWSFELLINKLKNKCEEFGIEFEQINERDTSSTCPICRKKVKPNDRTFKCKKCGYKQDRDVVGSIQILNKYSQDNNMNLRVENHPIVSSVLIEH
ncbi:MAG: IS200/IS605 family element transposase accessory protein TnpB [Candidatus Helarchaeota archaeon]|nr:IS200/IS605 family element transposase accessory protein TnpB [Candidatus Helarchaeota archaeon]